MNGSAARGRRLFVEQCAVCHETAPEFHKDGPSLAGVFDRKAGSAPYFTGYKGLRGATFVWTAERLDAWLSDPRGFLGGRDTRMTAQVKDAAQRADLIAYLATLN